MTDPSDTTSPLTLTSRGSVFESDWLKQVDLSLAFSLPNEKIDAQFSVDIFNLDSAKFSLRQPFALGL